MERIEEQGEMARDTVFIVDDDPSVLRAVGRLVRSAGWEVETFESPKKFLSQLKRAAVGCVILDLSMPDLDGLELQRELAATGKTVPIIFLTGNADVPTSVRAMKAGAIDFLSKPCSDDELLAAIRVALSRARETRRQNSENQALRDRFATLTPREHEVMLGVVDGLMNKQIAADLGAAEKTIKVHRARVMTKVGVESVAELARLAERAGLCGKT